MNKVLNRRLRLQEVQASVLIFNFYHKVWSEVVMVPAIHQLEGHFLSTRAKACKLNINLERLARLNLIQHLRLVITRISCLLDDHSSILNHLSAPVLQDPKLPHETFLLLCWALIHNFHSFVAFWLFGLFYLYLLVRTCQIRSDFLESGRDILSDKSLELRLKFFEEVIREVAATLAEVAWNSLVSLSSTIETRHAIDAFNFLFEYPDLVLPSF